MVDFAKMLAESKAKKEGTKNDTSTGASGSNAESNDGGVQLSTESKAVHSEAAKPEAAPDSDPAPKSTSLLARLNGARPVEGAKESEATPQRALASVADDVSDEPVSDRPDTGSDSDSSDAEAAGGTDKLSGALSILANQPKKKVSLIDTLNKQAEDDSAQAEEEARQAAAEEEVTTVEADSEEEVVSGPDELKRRIEKLDSLITETGFSMLELSTAREHVQYIMKELKDHPEYDGVLTAETTHNIMVFVTQTYREYIDNMMEKESKKKTRTAKAKKKNLFADVGFDADAGKALPDPNSLESIASFDTEDF